MGVACVLSMIKVPTGTPKECHRMVVDGGKEQSKAVVFFTTVPFLAGVVLSMNLQNDFKDGTIASEKVQEAYAAWMCLLCLPHVGL